MFGFFPGDFPATGLPGVINGGPFGASFDFDFLSFSLSSFISFAPFHNLERLYIVSSFLLSSSAYQFSSPLS